MSEQNKALIKKMYDAFGRGDIQTILDNVTSDVVWGMEAPSTIAFAGTRHGVAGVTSFFSDLASTQTDMKLTTEFFIAEGDHVATLGRYSCTIKATGKTTDLAVGHFFTIRNGKVARFVDMTDTAAVAASYESVSAAGR